MIRIKPVANDQASAAVQKAFADIARTLSVSRVPLIFQYIANSEDYLVFLWEQMKRNLLDDSFNHLFVHARSLSLSSIAMIYTPSSSMYDYISNLSENEKKELLGFVDSLLVLNIRFCILALILREELKSVFTALDTRSEKLRQFPAYFSPDDLSKEQSVSQRQTNTSEKERALFAPFFDSQFLSAIPYPSFFELCAIEIRYLQKKEIYLKVRVEYERFILAQKKLVVYRLGSSYREFMDMNPDKEIAYDLLYLLKNVFPSEFPHLTLACALMRCVLTKTDELVVR